MLAFARRIGHLPPFRGQYRIVNALVPWKRTGRHFRGIEELRGIRLHIDTRSMIEREIFFFGRYEDSTFSRLDALVRQSLVGVKTFVDIGANIGVFSLIAARTFRDVVAFEPNPMIRERFEENVALNSVHNIRILPNAVGRASGDAYLCCPAEANENHGVAGFSEEYMKREGIAYRRVLVDVVALDDVVERADVIKIDVEGFELDVLNGMSRLLVESRPTIIIEVAEEAQARAGHFISDIFDWFHSRRYALHEETSFRVVAKREGTNLFAVPKPP